nr:hypothetical protein CFP56_21733 [Quercus suber]
MRSVDNVNEQNKPAYLAGVEQTIRDTIRSDDGSEDGRYASRGKRRIAQRQASVLSVSLDATVSICIGPTLIMPIA